MKRMKWKEDINTHPDIAAAEALRKIAELLQEIKEAKKKTVVTKAVLVDDKFLAKHLTPKEVEKKDG